MIELHHVTKQYGTTTALRDVTFSVPRGQICGYVGPNGAGKSTTMKILVGVLRPTEGRARVAGFDVAEQPLEVKRRVGYVPETGAVYSTLSPAEYLALVGALHEMEPDEVAARTTRMLDLFQLSDQANQRLDTLSKGMRQKVVIAAALLHDPEVLLLDEPFSGLDANAVRTVKNAVRGLAERGKTVVFSSHMLDVVERLCDRLVVIHHGAIVADGPVAELVSPEKKQTLETVFHALTSTEAEEEVAAALVDTVHHEDSADDEEPAEEEPPKGEPAGSRPAPRGKRRRR